MRVVRERLLRGRRAIDPSEQFYLFGWVNWGGFRGRGLLGNNSNLVIKRRAGADFPPLLSAGVIMPRGGAILSILTGSL